MSQQLPVELQYVNRPEISETFADTPEKISIDGRTNTLRMEFCVIRMDDPKPGSNKQTGKKYPVSRIVMPLTGFLDLLNKVTQMGQILQDRGLLQKNPPNPNVAPGSGKLN